MNSSATQNFEHNDYVDAIDESLSVVLDIGKTVSKLSLWTKDARLVRVETHQNKAIHNGFYRALDTPSIEAWLIHTLAIFSGLGNIDFIIPVAHGATVAIIKDNSLFMPVMDYEGQIPQDVRQSYRDQRDAFSQTGSPEMEFGLNIGLQLHYIEHLYSELKSANITILPWAQYWAFLLSGKAVCEVTSLGAHSDLWNHKTKDFSDLCHKRGWAAKMAPMVHASTQLGPLRPEIIEPTGLSEKIIVLAGLHDSNAALHALRGHEAFGTHDATIISTGTWFVSMRSQGNDAKLNLDSLSEQKGCLVNIDIECDSVPTALFMGGRELERLFVDGDVLIDDASMQEAMLEAAYQTIQSDSLILPSFAPGIGPFDDRRGQWIRPPEDRLQRAAAKAVYLALVCDSALDLIGAQNIIAIDGRFNKSLVFVQALAALRPQAHIFINSAENDIAFGALRLVIPNLKPHSTLQTTPALKADMIGFRQRWRAAFSP